MALLLRHATWSAAEQFAQPMVLLVATPILLRLLGGGDFGLYALVLTLTAMSPLLALGTTSMVVREVSRFVDTQRWHSARMVVREALGIVLLVSLTVGCLALACFVLQKEFFPSMTSPASQVLFALGIGLLCAAVQEVDTLFASALKGMSRFNWSAGLEFAGRLLWLFLVGTAASSHDVRTVLLAGLLGLLAKAFAKGIVCAFSMSSPLIMLPAINPSSARGLLRRSLWLWVQGLGSVLLISADRLLAAHFFGVAAMGRYVACAQVAQFGLSVPAAAGLALIPWFTNQRSSAIRSSPARRNTLWWIALACATPGLFVAFASYPLLWLWLGKGAAASSWSLLSALGVGVAGVAAAVPFHYGLLSAGSTRPIAIANLAGGIGTIAACAIAAPLGLFAFGLAKLAYAIPLAFLPSILKRHLSRVPAEPEPIR